MKKQNGFTFVEVLVAVGIIMIIVMMMSSAMNSIFRYYARSQVKASADRQIENIKTKIRLDNSTRNASYDLHQEIDEDYTVFPFYWSDKFDLMSEEECQQNVGSTTCTLPGRLNYLVVQSADHRFYIAKLAIYHPELNGGQVKKVSFYVTVGQ
jgi:Tfp pilus assembly protein PilV